MSLPATENQLTLEDLERYFIAGFKKPGDFQVGVEWEKIGVYKDSGKAISYSGEKGVSAIFRELMAHFGWAPVYSDQQVVALTKQNASITLEPGGQIELSGQKAFSLDDNALELYAHLEELKKVSDPLGIAWLGIGVQPMSRLDEIEWVPKKRYEIMRELLKNKGELTYRMMKQTASIQVSLDYSDEKDAVRKLRLAMALSPVLTGLFANSPVLEGTVSPYLSARANIWSQTAPERTGILAKVFEPNFRIRDYIDYALDVPLLFITRGEKWIPGGDISFRTFLAKGLYAHTATMEDWNLHLTTLFTEARLKKYVEIRSADCQNKELGLSIPAFLKGLFYSETGLNRAWEKLEPYSYKERLALTAQAAKKGLETDFGKQKLADLAWEFMESAESGLKELVLKNPAMSNDGQYLAPLKNLLRVGLTPAEGLLRCFKSAASRQEKIQKILRCAAI